MRRVVLFLRVRDTDAQSGPYSPYSRFTVGQLFLFRPLFPFHCWLITLAPCAHVLSVAGLWAITTRFTVGLVIPVSLLDPFPLSSSRFTVVRISTSLRLCLS